MTPRAINMSKNHAGNVIMHSTKKDFCPEKNKDENKRKQFQSESYSYSFSLYIVDSQLQ